MASDPSELDLLPLAEPTTALRDFMHASRELTGRISRRAGMNPTDMTALGLLAMLGPLGAGDLARRLGIRTASATLVVDRLSEGGQVHRERHPTDRRKVTVHLAERARRDDLAAWGPVIAAMDDVARSLPPEHQVVVADYLARVTATVAAHPGAGTDASPADA